MEPDDLLCSRNARSRTPLVRRVEWDQARGARMAYAIFCPNS